MKNVVFGIVFIFVLSNFFCSTGEDPVTENHFNIYLYEDKFFSYWNLKNKKIDTLKLSNWLKADMVEAYDFSSHMIYLKDDIIKNELFSDVYLHGEYTRAFTFYANGKRCYDGSLMGCYYYPVICINSLCKKGYATDVFQITSHWDQVGASEDYLLFEVNDERNNENIKNALISDGKYLAGIDVKLSDISLNLDSELKLSGSIIITNNENSAIAIPDISYKIVASSTMGLSFSQKIVLYNQTTRYTCRLDEKSLNCNHLSTFPLVKLEGKESKYFTFTKKLFSGDSTIDEYPPDGNYYCFFMYYGIMECPKDHRLRDEGRVWMGSRKSNTMYVNFDRKKGITVLNNNVVFE